MALRPSSVHGSQFPSPQLLGRVWLNRVSQRNSSPSRRIAASYALAASPLSDGCTVGKQCMMHKRDAGQPRARISGGIVDKRRLQKLAEIRLKDAQALLGRKRWFGAYYLSGYAIECALKACLLKHLGEPRWIRSRW